MSFVGFMVSNLPIWPGRILLFALAFQLLASTMDGRSLVSESNKGTSVAEKSDDNFGFPVLLLCETDEVEKTNKAQSHVQLPMLFDVAVQVSGLSRLHTELQGKLLVPGPICCSELLLHCVLLL